MEDCVIIRILVLVFFLLPLHALLGTSTWAILVPEGESTLVFGQDRVFVYGDHSFWSVGVEANRVRVNLGGIDRELKVDEKNRTVIDQKNGSVYQGFEVVEPPNLRGGSRSLWSNGTNQHFVEQNEGRLTLSSPEETRSFFFFTATEAISGDGRRLSIQSLDEIRISHGKTAEILRFESEFLPREEYISGEAGRLHLLVLPAGQPGKGVVVLAHGSSPDEAKDLSWIAWQLHLQGFTVVSYDKRGSGLSEGDARTRSLTDMAEDLLSVGRWVARGPMAVGGVFVWGISQGTLVEALALSQPGQPFTRAVAVSAPSMPLRHQEMFRYRNILFRDDQRSLQLSQFSMRWWYLAEDMVVETRAGRFPYLGFTDPLGLDIDPAPLWNKVRVPVLFQYGGRDSLVPVGTSQRALNTARQGLPTEFRYYPLANHGMGVAQSGSFFEQTQRTTVAAWEDAGAWFSEPDRLSQFLAHGAQDWGVAKAETSVPWGVGSHAQFGFVLTLMVAQIVGVVLSRRGYLALVGQLVFLTCFAWVVVSVVFPELGGDFTRNIIPFRVLQVVTMIWLGCYFTAIWGQWYQLRNVRSVWMQSGLALQTAAALGWVVWIGTWGLLPSLLA